MRLRELRRGRVERRHAARRLGPAAVIIGDHRRVEGNRGQPLEAPHLAAVEIGGEYHPADQGRRHDRRRDQLARAPGEHCNAGEAARRRAAPTAPRSRGRAMTVDSSKLAVRGDDERASDPKPRCRIAERRLHRRLVAACDRGAEAEVPRQQLRGVLKLMRPLLPQPVVDRAARLKLSLDLARGGAGDEDRQRRRDPSIATANSSANWTVSRALSERKAARLNNPSSTSPAAGRSRS